MAKKKYDELAEKILQAIGGKENIVFHTHCITRLRFNLKDRGLVEQKEIEKISGVIGAQWAGEQLQIIIGQDVDEVYGLLCEKAELQREKPVDENLDAPKKKFSINMFFEVISGCLVPVIPVLAGAAFIRVALILLDNFSIISTASNTYFVLNFVYNASLYFLPVFVGAAAAKKFNTNMYLGMLMGAMLLAPEFVAKGSAQEAMSVFGIPITYMTYGYGSTIFPSIMSVFVMSYVERFWKKVSPKVLRTILVPFGTIFVMIPIVLCLMGPLGQFIGTGIAACMLWIYNRVGFLAIAIVAALQPILVMTGMHMSLVPARIQFCTTLGFDPLVKVAATISNYNQGIACLGAGLRTKDKDIKAMAFSSAATALLGGITEPAMYGVTVKYKRPLYAAMIGSFTGGLIAGLFGCVAYLASGTGLFALVSFIGERQNNLWQYCVALVVGMAVTFVLSYLFGIEEKAE